MKIKNTVLMWQEYHIRKKRSREVAIRGQNCVGLFTENETATDESEHDGIFITQIALMDDDQFKGQNTCSDVKESCGDNSVIQNSHSPYTTSETARNCSENEQSHEEIFNKQKSSFWNV